MQVSVVGFGRFGRVLASLLMEWHGSHLELMASSRSDYGTEARAMGLTWAALEEAARADVVILCVPIRELAGTIDRIGSVVRPGALVLDTCSVKVYPARVMSAGFGREVEILATHPMFGPDGVGQFGIAGQRMVLCPVRVSAEKATMVELWFGAMGVQILRMTPEEHDRQAAISQGLVHFIGRAVERGGFQEPQVTTNNAARLFEMTRSVANDSTELFQDLETFNPYAAEVRGAFLGAARELDESLRQRDVSGQGGTGEV